MVAHGLLAVLTMAVAISGSTEAVWPGNLLKSRLPTSHCSQGPVQIKSKSAPDVQPCARPDAILGGQDADDGKHRYMAAIVSYDETGKMQLRCGATLITPHHILLAAHCFFAKSGNQHMNIAETLSVIVGVADLGYADDYGVTLPMSTVKIHPDYNAKDGSAMGDLAVVKLADSNGEIQEAINDKCKADVVLLPESSTRVVLHAGQMVEALGWGRTETSKNSEKLKRVDIVYMPRNDCVKQRPQVSNATFCAVANEGRDTCARDSGGPVLVTKKDGPHLSAYYQVGVTHGGSKHCGTKGAKPSIYVDLLMYLDWIKKTVEDLGNS